MEGVLGFGINYVNQFRKSFAQNESESKNIDYQSITKTDSEYIEKYSLCLMRILSIKSNHK